MEVKEFEERARYQGGYDRIINNWKIIDIHQIPAKIEPNHEIDFYCSNQEKVYLLRLRHRKKECFGIKNTSSTTYLIAELPLLVIDDIILKQVLNIFMNMDI